MDIRLKKYLNIEYFQVNVEKGGEMAMYYWRSRCQWCGKTGNRVGTVKPTKPTQTPRVPGKCPSSSNGNHAPRWEED